jgi:hypothetical protein
MLLWGLLVGLLGVLALVALTPLESRFFGRDGGLRDAMTVLEHGGPLLVGRHGATGSLYVLGGADDEGIFVYIPLLGRLFGVSDPVTMMRAFYIALVGLTTSFYPLVFYRLTRSLLAGFAAPVMLLACIQSMSSLDIYWVPAWGMLTLLPPIYLLARDWPRFGLVALVGLSLAASWLSSIRNGSGLPIVIAAVIVLLLRRWRWWRVIPAVALLVVVYISINTFVFSAIRDHRDDRIAATALAHEQRTTSHPLWHSAYIGLGYLPNGHGIRYDDDIAIARARRDSPDISSTSSRYEAVIRGAYFQLVREHPLEAAKQYAAKIVVTVADSSPYLLIVLVTMPAMLLLGPHRRTRRLWVLLTLPGIILALLSPIAAIPNMAYEEALYGTLGVLGILGLCWAIERVEFHARLGGGLRSALGDLRAGSRAPGARHARLRQSMRISAAMLVVLVALLIAGHFIRQSAERWQGSSSGVLVEHLGA